MAYSRGSGSIATHSPFAVLTIRKFVFWLHLTAGVIAGLVIGIMSVTGTALAFEKQILARADNANAHFEPPTSATTRLPIADLLARVRSARPDARATVVTLSADPTSAIKITIGRAGAYYANPFTGELRAQGAPGWRQFFRTMEDWHRWLGRDGDSRTAGRLITGICNVAFLGLALTGLYLWWPRSWNATGLRAITRFNFKLRGRTRDWNWHNVFGFWAAPVLIVLTTTALVISFRSASDLVYRLAGSEIPGPGASTPEVKLDPAPVGALGQSPDALLAVAQQQFPNWEQVSLRLGSATARTPEPVVVIVRERAAWPRFANVLLTLDPYSGAVLRTEKFADGSLGRRIRSWMRFLHTGEALGLGGQLVAALASLAGAFLMWTGFALAWSRLGNWRTPVNKG